MSGRPKRFAVRIYIIMLEPVPARACGKSMAQFRFVPHGVSIIVCRVCGFDVNQVLKFREKGASELVYSGISKKFQRKLDF